MTRHARALRGREALLRREPAAPRSGSAPGEEVELVEELRDLLQVDAAIEVEQVAPREPVHAAAAPVLPEQARVLGRGCPRRGPGARKWNRLAVEGLGKKVLTVWRQIIGIWSNRSEPG